MVSLGGERQVGLLDDRQRIHVGSQCHHGPGMATFEHADDAGVRHAGFHFIEPQALEVLGNELARAKFPVREFGMLMDVAPPRDHLGIVRSREPINFGP